MSTEISFVPQAINLKLYAGDPAAIVLTAKNPDDSPLELTGPVTAQIRRYRDDDEALQSFATSVEGNQATITLGGDQTAELGDFTGAWDCQYAPVDGSPVTLIQGRVRCRQDVTRD